MSHEDSARRQRRALDSLARFHEEVVRATGVLERRHASRLRCGRGCSSCCVDGLTVFQVEAARIRRDAAELLATGTPHAEGSCAFLDEGGACRIYEHRPYVCRTQGLPLRWLQETPDGALLDLRDICPLNEDGEPVELLPPEDLWTCGPYEGRLAEIQLSFSEGSMERVALRELFPPSAERE
ncbi:MAG: YkgJ family cysteine cluster protein [Acidobacteriota bacterium]|nr:YkgJ family cysteine cluster protein [Acidobacteriota bacterium]